MYQREDGIVEFDPDVCIGCKACLQACPYDAIYIDPDSGTAAKCHYCAHRTDIGLEPACVVVCPEHAIIAGDLDDPLSEISKMLAENQVTVRKPEQGTAPKLFYVDGEEANLTPTAVNRTPESFAWADVIDPHGGNGHSTQDPPFTLPVVSKQTRNKKPETRNRNLGETQIAWNSGTPIRTAQPQGVPAGGPIVIGEGRMAEQMVQVAYNAQHKIPWHWPVPAYLVTKGIASGIFLILALGYILQLNAFDAMSYVAAGLTSLVFTVITTVLLVYDLERPERFLRILFRPQWKSWLARGAYLLVGFSIVSGAWWVLEAGAFWGFIPTGIADAGRDALLWLGIPLAIGAAIYTAFLFGQAEGRDLWQSTLLPFHLFVQALVSGSAALLILGAFFSMEVDIIQLGRIVFIVSLVVDLAVTAFGEFGMPHASEAAAKAAHEITKGRYRRHYWIGAIGFGHVAPLALIAIGMPWLGALAGLSALVGLYLYEYAFVMAPQEIPNS